jgi:peptide/nickel transport system substrate-binding protein
VAINTRRITDLKVRKALMYAYPREQIRQLLGGPDNGDFASTLSSPTLIGHEQYDLFQVPPKGDPEKAKALLAEAGKSGQKIVLVYGNVPRGEQVAVIVAQGLEKAGFTVVKKPLNIKTAQDDISRPDNQFDLYGAGWQADWPSGATVFPPLFDGRQIRPGGYNTSFFNDPAVNKEMDEISAIADPVEAGRRWSRLEQKIMAQVPMFPNLYSRIRQLHGPKIGGLALDNVQGGVSLNGVYVIP